VYFRATENLAIEMLKQQYENKTLKSKQVTT